MRGKVSVIIPARKEPYIRETLRDIYAGAVGDIEVILVIDGEMPDYEIPEYKNLRIYHNSTSYGLRPCLNAAVDVAKGKYLLKLDAHCTIGEGWDKILKADCEDNWIVVPQRYWFDAPTWTIIKDRPHVDAMQYKYPFKQVYLPRLTGRPWPERGEEYKDEMIVEDMTYQGSGWFMQRKHWHRIGGMPHTDGYGTFGEEPQEMGLKTQLGPWEGKIVRNKNTWYAHWSKPMNHWHNPEDNGRVPTNDFHRANIWSFEYWWNNRYPQQAHDFEWLIEKFEPIPRWPEDWRWLVTQYTRHEMPKIDTIGYTPIDTEAEFRLMERVTA